MIKHFWNLHQNGRTLLPHFTFLNQTTPYLTVCPCRSCCWALWSFLWLPIDFLCLIHICVELNQPAVNAPNEMSPEYWTARKYFMCSVSYCPAYVLLGCLPFLYVMLLLPAVRLVTRYKPPILVHSATTQWLPWFFFLPRCILLCRASLSNSILGWSWFP